MSSYTTGKFAPVEDLYVVTSLTEVHLYRVHGVVDMRATICLILSFTLKNAYVLPCREQSPEAYPRKSQGSNFVSFPWRVITWQCSPSELPLEMS